MGGVFSDESAEPDVEKVPDVDEEVQQPAAAAPTAQEGGNTNRRRAAVSRRQTHHRSRLSNKRKTIRNRTRE